jgi:crotonobetainyl-CoA:carnitine CoA-transferase CaiB-like acyl-CoA transferase
MGLADQLRPAIKAFRSDDLLDRFIASGVPAAPVNDLHDLFLEAEARSMVLEQTEPDGRISKRVATAVFEWEPYED